MRKPLYLFALPLLFVAASSQAAEPKNLKFFASIEASSEPVSIQNMIHGWSDSAQGGDYAFADMLIKTEYRERNYVLALESRWFYSLAFTPGTVDWYLEVDQGVDNDYSGDIELRYDAFDAIGASIGYEFEFSFGSITPILTRYVLNHYQFGELDGVAAPGRGIDVSANLDYYFDDDKILEYDVPEGDRSAYSLTLLAQFQPTEQVAVSLELRDLWNRFKLSDASFRQGCINLGEVDNSVCDLGDSSVEGVDGNKDVLTDIPATLISRATHNVYGLEAELYWHDRYQRLSLAKDWSLTSNLGAGLVLTSLNQVGVRGRYKMISWQYLVDDAQVKKARDGRFFLGLDYSW